MSLLYEHQFAGGTAVRFIDKPFQAAQKEVLTVEMDLPSITGELKTYFAFLFDNDTKIDLAKELYIALHERYNPTLNLVRDKLCKTCQLSVCNDCRILAQQAHVKDMRDGKIRKVGLVSIGKYRYKNRKQKTRRKIIEEKEPVTIPPVAHIMTNETENTAFVTE